MCAVGGGAKWPQQPRGARVTEGAARGSFRGVRDKGLGFRV